MALGKRNTEQVTLLGEEVKKSIEYREFQKKCHNSNHLVSNVFPCGERRKRGGNKPKWVVTRLKGNGGTQKGAAILLRIKRFDRPVGTGVVA